MKILSAQQHLGIAALLLAASNLLSRLMGLIRDKIISWQFGAGSEADMYFAAFVVPDCINYLLAGGFMSITMIPLLSRAFADDENDAWEFFSAIVTWMFCASCILTLLCMYFAQPLSQLIAPGFSHQKIQRLAFFMRIILPAQIFFLTGSCATALLFLRKQFRIPALTPLIYNGAIIACGLCLPYASEQIYGMTGYCFGVTLGAFLGAFLLPFFVAKGGKLHIHVRFTHPYLKKFFLIAMPLMLGQTIVMLDEPLLRIFGSFLEEGYVSILNYARRISQVPIGLVGQACAVASYPFLVELLTKGDTQAVQTTLTKALHASLLIAIPIVACMIALSWSCVTLIFHGGRFGAEEVFATTPLLQIMLAAVPFWIVYMIVVRAFYAHQNTITPAVTGTLITCITLPIYYAASQFGNACALAVISATSVSIYTLWLSKIWNSRYERLTGIFSFAVRVLFTTIPAACAAYCVQQALVHTLSFSPLLIACIALILCGFLFCCIFIPMGYILIPQMRTLIRNLLRNLIQKRSC